MVLGLSAGTLIGLLAVPPRASDSVATTPLQVQELTRKLETAKEDKERVDRQLEQFAKLADQMTASFSMLEQRFKALEEEQRLREAARDQAFPTPTRAAAPAATARVPEGQPPPASGDAAQAPSHDAPADATPPSAP